MHAQGYARRPHVLLSEGFCRQYDVRFRRPAELPEAKCEEINYTKVALKYGHNCETPLTKDLVKEALKRIVSKVGELFQAGADLEITFGENSALVQDASARFYFRLIDGEFPDYGPVIPKAPKRQARVLRESFSSALKRVGLLAADKTRPVRFAFSADAVTISAQNSDIGEAREVVPIELQGDELEVGFNVKYFVDVLNVVGSEYVTVNLGDALSPAVIVEPDTEDSLFVVMPMRLD